MSITSPPHSSLQNKSLTRLLLKRLNLIFPIFLTLLFIVGSIVFLLSRRDRPARPPEEAKIALKSLQKIKAATEVGVSYMNYQQLVIAAKAEVNAASSKLPSALPKSDGTYDLKDYPSKLRYELNEAMDAYADAQRMWEEKNAGRKLSLDTEPGKTLLPKYKLTTTDPDDALQILWEIGNISTLSSEGAINILSE